ncbi:hypothetical protein [Pleionea litopenaei]|uniref:Uncharacterized protein n=1 Tax=Pleionea litopenaei TaxID=3070815 RepID=A0AA51RWS9_9GAMM|nr:hypothetical protein [Pleionea sp. HL-JVS1]WMS88939.1 hypothetical protein Q9312_08495 [Pleionea sp. HL-JVS1]
MKTIAIGPFIIYSWEVNSSNEFNFLMVDRQSGYAAIFDFSIILSTEQIQQFQNSVLSIIKSQDYSLQWWFSSHPINKENIIIEQCSDVILAMSDKHKAMKLEDNQSIDYFYTQDEIITLGNQALNILYTSTSYEIIWSEPLLLMLQVKVNDQPVKVNDQPVKDNGQQATVNHTSEPINSSKIREILSKLPNYSEVLSNTTDCKQPFRLCDLQ